MASAWQISRKLRGISVSHYQADVVPDHSRFRNAEGVSKRMNSDSGRLHVETVLGNIGFAYAGQIGSNYRELVDEPRYQRPPHSRGLHIAMHENDRRSAPRCEVVNLYPFHRGELRFD